MLKFLKCRTEQYCEQCQVAYQPLPENSPLRSFCSRCRPPHLAKYEREQQVLAWTRFNIEKVGKLMDAEEIERRAAMSLHDQAVYAGIAASAQYPGSFTQYGMFNGGL